MDTQTRHALKQDRLVEATRTSVDWFQENRSRVITACVAAVICVAILVAGLVLYGKRSAAAELAFGEAMDTYNAPLAQPGQPPTPGEKTFATAAERAKLANQQFAQVADQYGLFEAGKTAELNLAPNRHAWLHVARGKVKIDGKEFGEGDGVAISDQQRVAIEGVDEGELLAFDLA